MQLRRAVNYEFFMSMFHGESPMHFATTAMVNGPLSLEQIQAAGLKLQQKHPLLRAKVVFDEHGDPWINSYPEIGSYSSELLVVFFGVFFLFCP